MPRHWDFDPLTGAKRSNKWRSTESFYPFLNGLTRSEFEDCVRKSGLTVLRRESHGFSGSRVARVTRALIALPVVGECFVSFHVYQLRKPA